MLARRIILCLSLSAAMLLASCMAKFGSDGAQWHADATNAQSLDRVVTSIMEQHYQQALVELPGLVMLFEAEGDARRAAESLFWIGYCYEKLGRTTDAARAYEQVSERYPQQPAAAQAVQRRAQLAAAAAAEVAEVAQ